MITNPNTLGLFESNIKEIAELVHARGGLVYGDGANLNAIMGYAHMGHIGIDVMHMEPAQDVRPPRTAAAAPAQARSAARNSSKSTCPARWSSKRTASTALYTPKSPLAA